MNEIRDAALNWHEHYKCHFESLGFTHGKANPCFFRKHETGINVFVHGLDYVSSGHGKSLKWMAEDMEKQYECKIQLPWPDAGNEKQTKVPNRIVSWNKTG